jgi:hypothetical protein
MSKYFWLLLIGFSLMACDNFNQKKDEDTESKKKNMTTENEPDTNSNADILNNIIVHEKGGVKLSHAFLSYEDGRLVPRGNKTALSQPVFLNLMIEKGWTVQDAKVSIDASTKIETNNGELVVNAPNLFKAMLFVDESRANAIQLKARITKTRPGIAYFLINYHVWDKRGNGEVKGSYKLYIE